MSLTIPYEKDYRGLLKKRGLAKKDIEKSVKNASEYTIFLESRRVSVEESSLDDVKKYIKKLIENGRNLLDRVNSICMYTNAVGKLDARASWRRLDHIRHL